MLTDTEEQVRRNAAYSLARLGTAIEPGTVEENAVVTPLRAALTDEYHYVRGLAALALERIGTPAAMNAALSQLQVARFD
jgi:HEAT repeat protein